MGNNIHIAAYSALWGGTAGIRVCDFANISSRVCVYAISDDYSGHSMTNSTIPDEYKNIQNESVLLVNMSLLGLVALYFLVWNYWKDLHLGQ